MLKRICLNTRPKKYHQAATKPTSPILPHLFCTLQQEHTLCTSTYKSPNHGHPCCQTCSKAVEPSLFDSSLPQWHTNRHTGLLQRGSSLQDVATNAAAGSLGMQVRAKTADLLETYHRAHKQPSNMQRPSPAVTCRQPSFRPQKRATRPSTTRRWRKLRPVFAAWIHSSAKTWAQSSVWLVTTCPELRHVPHALFPSPGLYNTPLHMRAWHQLRPLFAAQIHSSARASAPVPAE